MPDPVLSTRDPEMSKTGPPTADILSPDTTLNSATDTHNRLLSAVAESYRVHVTPHHPTSDFSRLRWIVHESYRIPSPASTPTLSTSKCGKMPQFLLQSPMDLHSLSKQVQLRNASGI